MQNTYNIYKGKAYRFLSFKELFDTLRAKTLRFSRTDAFSDPMDSSPFLVNMEWKKLSKLPSNIVSSFYQQAIDNSNDLASLYLFCLSREYASRQSYLIWSRYAQSHSQVCFEIDFSKSNYLGGPSIVSYVENLASARDSYSGCTSEFKPFVVTTKSDRWEYEQEVRLIVDASLSPKAQRLQQSNEGKNLHVPFDVKIISKVIFGVRASEENIHQTLEYFKGIGCKPIFERMRINLLTLELEAIPF